MSLNYKALYLEGIKEIGCRGCTLLALFDKHLYAGVGVQVNPVAVLLARLSYAGQRQAR